MDIYTILTKEYLKRLDINDTNKQLQILQYMSNFITENSQIKHEILQIFYQEVNRIHENKSLAASSSSSPLSTSIGTKN